MKNRKCLNMAQHVQFIYSITLNNQKNEHQQQEHCKQMSRNMHQEPATKQHNVQTFYKHNTYWQIKYFSLH